MKISRAIDFCLKYHKINSRPNTVANYEFILKNLKKDTQAKTSSP
jgi:hypothetical protein